MFNRRFTHEVIESDEPSKYGQDKKKQWEFTGQNYYEDIIGGSYYEEVIGED